MSETANLPIAPPEDIKDFGWMETWLGRGAQPTPVGFNWLASHGIRTVVNLRAEDDSEAVLDNKYNLTSIYFPVADNTAPSQAQALQWLGMCANLQNRPLFVHCQKGHGRTSTFCILVRLAQGWKLKDAIAESVEKYGFQPDHDPDQVKFLHAFHDLLKTGSIEVPQL